jgi:hypothetical protein
MKNNTMKKARITLAVVALVSVYLAPSLALYLEKKSHAETRARLLTTETDLNEAWQMVQELRATLAAMQ